MARPQSAATSSGAGSAISNHSPAAGPPVARSAPACASTQATTRVTTAARDGAKADGPGFTRSIPRHPHRPVYR